MNIIPREIENKLKEIIETAIEGKKLKKRSEDDRTEQEYLFKKSDVKVGFLQYGNLEDIVPAITIRRFKGKNTLNENIVKIRVLVGLYGLDTEESYTTLSEIIRTIQEKVLNTGTLTGIVEDGTESKKYEISPEAEWDVSEEQPYPYWIGYIIFEIKEFKDYRNDTDPWINGKI